MNINDLQTERLKFRKLNLDDLDALMEYYNSAEALAFMPYTAGDRNAGNIVIGRQLARYEACEYDGLRAVILKSTGSLIGMIGLLIQEVDGITELEVGYHLIPGYWKNGYAIEAAKAFKQFAFDTSLAESLISIIHINNKNSHHVAERNGMKVEKFTSFKDIPVVIYRIHKTDYLKTL